MGLLGGLKCRKVIPKGWIGRLRGKSAKDKAVYLTASQITSLRPQWTKEKLVKLAGCNGRRLDEPTYILDRIIKLEEKEEFKNWRKK